MLILLAASRVPSLKLLVGPQVLKTGAHLSHLIKSWTYSFGFVASPSVEQSLKMICEIDGFIQHGYEA